MSFDVYLQARKGALSLTRTPILLTAACYEAQIAMLKCDRRCRRDYGTVFSASEAGEGCHDESAGKSARSDRTGAAREES